MTKLVVSDLDGTLLRDDKYLDKEIYAIIHGMTCRGVQFVAASGRQYHSMSVLFAPVLEEVYLISDNGSRILFRGEALYERAMDQQLAREILSEVLELPEVTILLCCRKMAYSNSHNQEAYLRSSGFKYHVTFTQDLMAAALQDEILKISLIDGNTAMDTLADMTRRYGERVAVTFSGYNCVDLMDKEVNKGAALALLQARLGVTPAETIVFGDNLNDLEMMGRAGAAYAMRHSPAAVKGIATQVLGDNNDGAAIDKLRELFPPEAPL